MNASTAHADAMIYIARMNITSATEVKYLKGVGPQRAAAFASRGIHTVNDLLVYLPFRYEDRIRFNRIAEIAPGGTYTIHGTVARRLWCVLRAAGEPSFIYWLETRPGRCRANSFTAVIWKDAFARGSRLWCTARRSSIRGPAGSR